MIDMAPWSITQLRTSSAVPGRLAMTLLVVAFFLFTYLSLEGHSLESDVIIKGSSEEKEYVVSFQDGGGLDPSMMMRVPGEGPITHVSLLLQTVDEEKGPETISIDIGLDNRREWSFGGGEFGRFGEQVSFRDGNAVKRGIPTSQGGEISFLLPWDSTLNSSRLSVLSPPSPEGGASSEIGDISYNVVSGEHLDSADLDGMKPDDIVVHDVVSGDIFCYYRNGTKTQVKKLASSIKNLNALRAFSTSVDVPGGVIFSRMDDDQSFQDVHLITVDKDLASYMHRIGTGIAGDAPAFSLRQASGDPPSIKCITGNRGTVLKIVIEDELVLVKDVILDTGISLTGITEADMDGDDDLDLILWPSQLSSNNVTVMENTGNLTHPIYDKRDSTLRKYPTTLSLPYDIDGDGKEEVFLGLGQGASPAVASLSKVGKLKIGYLGLNDTSGSFRALDRDMYGDGGAYDGGEGLLYLITDQGIVHLLPESSVQGRYLSRRSESPSAFSLITDEEDLVSFHNGSSIKDWELKWTGSTSASLSGHGGAGKIMLDPSKARSGIDIGPLLSKRGIGVKVYDDHNNAFEVMSFNLTSNDGHFISLKGLSLSYSVSLDASSSDSLLSAVVKARETFEGDVPFSISASSSGTVKVGPSLIVYDSPPTLRGLPETVELFEGDPDSVIIDLKEHILDDSEGLEAVRTSAMFEEGMPEGLLYLDAEHDLHAMTGTFHDAFGEFEVRFRISDERSFLVSPIVKIIIHPVQDGPRAVIDIIDISLYEGEPFQMDITPLFYDPDGDPLHFSLEVLTVDTSRIDPFIEVMDDILFIFCSTDGIGGSMTVMITAVDAVSGLSSNIELHIDVIDVDAPMRIGENPGMVLLIEDQERPTLIPLDGWFVDPDTPLYEKTFRAYPSHPDLNARVVLVDGSPYLYLLPVRDLNGYHHVWVDASSNDVQVFDRVMVNIRPVNDPPKLTITSYEPDSAQWIVRGSVEDVDSRTGRVQFRIGTGPWREADGWKEFQFAIPYEDLDIEGSLVSIRADDLEDISETELMTLGVPLPWGLQFIDSDGDGIADLFDEFPNDPNEWYDTDGDGVGDNSDAFPFNPFEWMDSDGDGVGDNSDAYPYDPTRHLKEVVMDIPPRAPDGRLIWAAGGAIGTILGLLVFFLFTEVGFVIVATAAATLYSKLSTKDVMNHEIRGLIRGYIIANPGDHYSSIKRNLDLNNGTLAYHLRVLEQNGFVKSLYDGVFKRYYPANVNISKVKKNVSKQEEVFNIILEHPNVSMEEIGRMIGVSRQVVNYHVKNLIRSGLIDYRRDIRSAKFYAVDNGNGHELEQ